MGDLWAISDGSPTAGTAEEAVQAIKAITAQRIDLPKNAAADRQIAAERWKAWWQANGSKP